MQLLRFVEADLELGSLTDADAVVEADVVDGDGADAAVAPDALDEDLVGLERRPELAAAADRQQQRDARRPPPLRLVVVEAPDRLQPLAVVVERLDVDAEAAEARPGRVDRLLVHVVEEGEAARRLLRRQLRAVEEGARAAALRLQDVAAQVDEVAWRDNGEI